MKICVVGGGSSYTPELLEGLINNAARLSLEKVALLDVEEGREKLETIAGLAERMVRAAKAEFELFHTLDPVKAIKDSDFVIFQFRPGFLAGRIRDEKIPLKYDLIGQETTGVGGFSSGLRAFPIIDNYVSLIREYAPQAFIVSFTNPSGMVTEYIANYLGYEKAVGLCNGPVNFAANIAHLLGKERKDIFLKYYGLNHLAWIERVYLGNEDVTSRAFSGLELQLSNIPGESLPPWFIQDFGLFPNPYLKYYYQADKMLEEEKRAAGTTGTRGEVVKKIERELFKKYADPSLARKPEELSKRGGAMYSTAATEFICDLWTAGNVIHILNVKNDGAIQNLPPDYVMEIPGFVGNGAVRPVTMGRAREQTIGLIHTIKNFERLTIESSIEKSREKALRALLIHPLGPKVDYVKPLLEEIIEANRGWIDM